MPEQLLERLAQPSHTTGELEDGLDRIGVALADPIRRRILVRLLDGSQRPSDLADAIGTSRSNLSNHLSCLRGCGLIEAERAGRHLHYRLMSEQFADALRMLLHAGTNLPECTDHLPEPTAARQTKRANA